eukprot:CAMPEP_0194134468 /NCGR_PEP_ID=MMETSP0152-20130528/4546_1 /TAXON_ID=1049557 /ORGANISM="Thalassiothrix antarctica, Strain L6-D1" /LENGTH=1063 /DNA_ID=CAMNT_0038830223 /DNA_START=66 /DNA_END=3257 /DNA_ORIENTATION=+
MKYTAFHEKQFHGLVNKALQSVRKILDVNRNPRIAEDMNHTYDDKYALVEFLTNTAIAAQINILERMGLSETKLKRLIEIVQNENRTITLCFEAEDSCMFLKEQMVDVIQHESGMESSKTTTTGASSLFYGSSSSQQQTNMRQQVVQKVREYHWKVTCQYRVYCYDVNDPLKNHNSIDLLARSASTTITTTGSRESPFPSHTKHSPIFHDFTWILRQMKEGEDDGQRRTCCFEIDRLKSGCFTPRRNDEIDDAIYFFDTLSSWFSKIRSHFTNHIEGTILAKHDPASSVNEKVAPELKSIFDAQIFTPVLPLMEPNNGNNIDNTTNTQGISRSLLVLCTNQNSSSPLLSLGDIEFFLNEQRRSIGEAMTTLTAVFPSHQLMKLVTVAEASLVLFSSSVVTLFNQYQQSIEYIEEMLRSQLVTAIGKEINPEDFNRFVSFHNRKIFAPQFRPTSFSYTVRRPNHYPDGVIAIESKISDTGKTEPINTHTCYIPGDEKDAMMIPINSSTTLEMTGDRYLHGWMNHRFESSSIGSYTLTARARQFSSFMLLVGVLGGANVFEPKDAIIVQNKDEILIPLLLKELPSAKEFKDSISSLSPEQQRFAKAFRGMQLESSVFAVCVIQLKPQLEALLGLPENALTKEIKLTQDLLSLFVHYQIPSDLLSFDGPEDFSKVNKLHAVKKHVATVMEVISETKKSELEEMEQRAHLEKNKLEAEKRFEEVRKRVSATQGTNLNPTLAIPGGQMHHPLSAALSKAVPLPEDIAAAASVELVGGDDKVMDEVSESISRSNHAYASSSPSPPSVFQPEGLDRGTVTTIKKGEEGAIDFTNIPKQLDSLFEEKNSDDSVRATTIETQLPWLRLRQEGLLSNAGNFQKKKPIATKMDDELCGYENDKALDLLDALSRSGTLPLKYAELHVVVAMTHCFENDVMGTVIQDNVNPIEKVERSIFMLANTIHGTNNTDTTMDQMISEGPHRQRILNAVNDTPLLTNTCNSDDTTSEKGEITVTESLQEDVGVVQEQAKEDPVQQDLSTSNDDTAESSEITLQQDLQQKKLLGQYKKKNFTC